MATKVVNIHHGSKYDQYIGRAGKGQDGTFGNPFWMSDESKRGEAINKFRAYFNNRVTNDFEFKTKVLALKDKTLGCFCYPKKCHGDIIVEYLDSNDPG